MSDEGYFVKIARSGRVEFPRREPVGGGPVEWLSVRTASGPVGVHRVAAGRRRWPAAARPAAARRGRRRPAAGAGPGRRAPELAAGATGPSVGGFPTPGGQRAVRPALAVAGGQRHRVDRASWRAPSGSARSLRTEWESGPFTYPVEAPVAGRVARHGRAVRAHRGRPRPRRLRPLAGGDPRHRRPRRAAGARRPGSTGGRSRWSGGIERIACS